MSITRFIEQSERDSVAADPGLLSGGGLEFDVLSQYREVDSRSPFADVYIGIGSHLTGSVCQSSLRIQGEKWFAVVGGAGEEKQYYTIWSPAATGEEANTFFLRDLELTGAATTGDSDQEHASLSGVFHDLRSVIADIASLRLLSVSADLRDRARAAVQQLSQQDDENVEEWANGLAGDVYKADD